MILLTIPDAAKRLGRTPATIYAAISRGDLTCTEMYGRKLVNLQALQRYQRSVKVGRPKNGHKK